MTPGAFVYALFAGGLIATGTWALDALLRQHRRATRWAWAAGLVALVVVVVRAVLLTPAATNGGDVLRALGTTTSGVPAGAAPGMLASLGEISATLGAAVGAMLAAGARVLPAPFVGWLSVLWLGGTALLLLSLLYVHLRLARARRAWPETMLHGRVVRISAASGPAVLGVLRPCIVVPRWLLARSAEEQRLVVAHEDEHVCARDHLLLAAACVVVALVPWHPAAWWMWARLRLAIELDCDARLLRRGVPARAYGSLLIDLAGHCSGSTVGATALADDGSHLERRLLAMTASSPRYIRLRAGALCAVGALAFLAACEAKIPTSAEIDAMDVAGAQRLATTSRMIDKGHHTAPTFFVNGVKASPEEAHAITPNQIAEVTVEKGPAGATIRITTNAETTGPATGAAPLRRLHGAVHGGTAPRSHASGPDHAMMSGLIFVDGVRIDATALHRLDPKSFVTVDVIKGAEAARRYSDPAAANGVIQITTRRAAP